MYINECKATASFSLAYLEKNMNCWKCTNVHCELGRDIYFIATNTKICTGILDN